MLRIVWKGWEAGLCKDGAPSLTSRQRRLATMTTGIGIVVGHKGAFLDLCCSMWGGLKTVCRLMNVVGSVVS
ncbi:hypothetical protein JYU34_003931 [Plutella xylostella]|uniref:Uncharacterized protein n=1 Tax=Plutella xylostella TaxID=51655 RepID=A0ABQ7R196_PLUXY|nr:hypothetical protein JYU34_003931 [Plutella xylostella]